MEGIAWIDQPSYHDKWAELLRDTLGVDVDMYTNANYSRVHNFKDNGADRIYQGIFLNPNIPGVLPENREPPFDSEVGLYLLKEIIRAEYSVNKDTPVFLEVHEIADEEHSKILSRQDWLEAGATDVFTVRENLSRGIDKLIETFRNYIQGVHQV